MLSYIFSILILSFAYISTSPLTAEESFLLIDGSSKEIVCEIGTSTHERASPCSTFKIVLSLMGYDAEILKDEKNPNWAFQEGYDTYLESWRAPQNPTSWMKESCVWYSKLLAYELGLEKIQSYLALLEYGNQDLSGGLEKLGSTNPAWINSSLEISPKEQVDFIQKMINEKLPISQNAIQRTKVLLFKEELQSGWKLFGKTGTGKGKEGILGWFVGWIEKENCTYVFSYNIQGQNIDISQRIPRVKELLQQTDIFQHL